NYRFSRSMRVNCALPAAARVVFLRMKNNFCKKKSSSNSSWLKSGNYWNNRLL
ncbi:MAG: hypothetical protein ACJAVF_004386, partial [Paraglaciecola sp.]